MMHCPTRTSGPANLTTLQPFDGSGSLANALIVNPPTAEPFTSFGFSRSGVHLNETVFKNRISFSVVTRLGQQNIISLDELQNCIIYINSQQSMGVVATNEISQVCTCSKVANVNGETRRFAPMSFTGTSPSIRSSVLPKSSTTPAS